MKSPLCVTRKKQTASFKMMVSTLAIAPLWLMLAATNTSAYAQATSSPADWTQFHRDNMQRWNPYETILGVSNVGSLNLKWTNTIGASEYSSPAVVNGMVYFGSRVDKSLHAVNASTGALLWSYTTDDEVISSPAVANGMVYFSSGSVLYALNATTGTKLWSFDPFAPLKPVGNEFDSPTVANGVVYVGADKLYALNAGSGAQLWSYDAGAPVNSPAVANGMVYFNDDIGNLYALNASTGAKLWSSTSANFRGVSPAVANGIVYFGSFDRFVYALNASTGAVLWSFETDFSVEESSPAVANGVVYIADSSNLYALNARTGAKLWSYFISEGVESSPAVANGVAYIVSSGSFAGIGHIYALNANTGAVLWSYAINEGNEILVASPAIVDGVVYIHTGGGNYAFGLGPEADLFLRIQPSATTVHQGDLITYAFPVWDLGPSNAVHEVLTTQVPEGTNLDYIRVSGTPGLGTCTSPPYQGTGKIVCHENSAMAPNTTWTVRVVVKVTAPAGTVITENAATMADTPDPNLANNTASVSLTVQ
jgi:outer membrane protein assembly factor BamB